IMCYGHPGVGKSWFTINTWDVADTLFFANFDRDAAHLIKKYEGKGGVYYDQFTALTKPQAEAVLEKIQGMANAAISKGKSVFVLDNAAAAADIVVLALYDPKGYGAMSYGGVNTWWRDFLLPLEKAGIWCLLTGPSKELWAETKSLGLYTADTWKHLDNPIMSEVWLFTNRTLGAKTEPQSAGVVGDLELQKDYPDLEYKAEIRLAKKRPAVQGMLLKNPSLLKILRAMKEVG
ncbi:hypothetical protein LCGC14_2557090, partial [marine sediment metagenome]